MTYNAYAYARARHGGVCITPEPAVLPMPGSVFLSVMLGSFFVLSPLARGTRRRRTRDKKEPFREGRLRAAFMPQTNIITKKS